MQKSIKLYKVGKKPHQQPFLLLERKEFLVKLHSTLKKLDYQKNINENNIANKYNMKFHDNKKYYCFVILSKRWHCSRHTFQKKNKNTANPKC